MSAGAGDRPAGLGLAAAIDCWDGALAAIRGWLRGEGLREVRTRCLRPHAALEPFIEPIAAGSALLRTSPELAHKRLLGRGAGSIFELGPVFRAGERGAWHRPEFTLLEWYRVEPARPAASAFAQVGRDVEALVAAVEGALAARLAARGRPPIERWETIEVVDALAELAGLSVAGDEDSAALRARVAASPDPEVRAWLGPPRLAASPGGAGPQADAQTLADWTALWSSFCDRRLDPWLARQPPTRGWHVVGFPRALAALARCEGPRAARRESYAWGLELANAYDELADVGELTRRFQAVAALRRALGQPPLPWPGDWLDALGRAGLPPCAGAALGVERLLAGAAGAASLAPVLLDDDPG